MDLKGSIRRNTNKKVFFSESQDNFVKMEAHTYYYLILETATEHESDGNLSNEGQMFLERHYHAMLFFLFP